VEGLSKGKREGGREDWVTNSGCREVCGILLRNERVLRNSCPVTSDLSHL